LKQQKTDQDPEGVERAGLSVVHQSFLYAADLPEVGKRRFSLEKSGEKTFSAFLLNLIYAMLIMSFCNFRLTRNRGFCTRF